MPEEATTEPIEEPKRDAWQGLDPGPARTAGSPIERGEAIDPRTGNPVADPDNPKSAFDQRDWGSLFNMFFFKEIKDFIKTQNPSVGFFYNSETPLAHEEILSLPGGPPTLNVGGFIPELHGYMTGLSTALHTPFLADTAMGFRVYKNGNPTHCILYVTDDNNGENGIVWSDRFNANPFYAVANEGTPAGVHDFLANDRIIIVAEDPQQPPAGMGAGIVNKTMATNIKRLDFWWHFSYEKLTYEFLREILAYPFEGGEFTGVPPGGVGPGEPGNGGNGGGEGSGSGGSGSGGSGSEPDIPT